MSADTLGKMAWGHNQVLVEKYSTICREKPDLSRQEIQEIFLANLRVDVLADFLSSLEHEIPESTLLSELPESDLGFAVIELEENYFIDLDHAFLCQPDTTLKMMLDHVMDSLKERPMMVELLS
jgi:hypothetical protein